MRSTWYIENALTDLKFPAQAYIDKKRKNENAARKLAKMTTF